MVGHLPTALTTQDQIRLLVVDDDPALLQSLPHMLKLRLGTVHVDTADSAYKAIEQVQACPYDTIISDIKMPGMDGLDLLHVLGTLQPETPVLLITGHGEHDLALRALRGGAYDYVLKPINRDDFAASVRRAIDTARLRRQVKAQQQALEQYATSLEQQVRQRTEELLTANSELAAVNQAREHMLRMVVHEMAGPLTSVKGMVQLVHLQVQRGQVGEKVEQNFDTIESALHRLERLIADLYDTAHIQGHSFALQYESIDLLALCQQVLDEFACEPVSPFTREGQEAKWLTEVDPQRVSQVLLNLLSNARKYSPAEAPITVTFSVQGSEVRIAVQDEGIGIAPEVLPHICEQFYRVPETMGQRKSATGLGLGLYITRAIVEAHDGHLEIASRPGSGSTFTLVLPSRSRLEPAAQRTLEEERCLVSWRIEHRPSPFHSSGPILLS